MTQDGFTGVPALEMRGMTKRYPGVVANDHIDLDVRPGEIHALLGENGAGKTTLMNVLYGLAKPDEGQILLGGKPVQIAGPSDAIARGISMVHQHFMLVPVLSVADNVILGAETMAGPLFIDAKEARRRIADLAGRFGFELDPDAKVGSLSVGQQQRVEILKALYREAQILVLDEPTAVLTPQETEEIFVLLRRLAADGRSIIFISHKLYEVLEIADRITVIRRGKVIGERKPAETTEEELAELMVGRAVELTVDRGQSHTGKSMLRIEGLRVLDMHKRPVIDELSLEVKAGEILGVAGVAGNGQDELIESIVGMRRPDAGKVLLDGEDVTNFSPRKMNMAEVAYVPGDRHRFGLVLGFPVHDNLVLTRYYAPPYSRSFLRDDDAIEDSARRQVEKFDIRTPSVDVPAATLSGGNQQKIIVAREFDRPLKLLVLDQPTRGLDVGSIEFIHRQIIAKRNAGTAVLLISAELDEVMEMSDRIAVMYRGRVVAEMDGRTADKSEVGLYMATGRRDAAAEEAKA